MTITTEMEEVHRLTDALVRTDFLAFSEKCFHTLYPGQSFFSNWHHQAMAAALADCAPGGTCNRLLINLPPRHMKSEIVSVFFSAWLLAHDPSCTIISVCYGEDLCSRLSRSVRKIMQASWYKWLFPATRLSAEKCTETELETTVNGRRYATTVRGEIVGHGADYIIIDDPSPVGPALTANLLKGTVNWYSEQLVSRLTHRATGAIIGVMQRARPDDLAGYLIQTGAYRQLCLPLIAVADEKISLGNGEFHERKAGDILHPEWLGPDSIENLRAEMSDIAFEAQYQQDPKPGGGALLKLDYFSRYDRPGMRHEYEQVWLVCDCASSLDESASYSVCMVFGVKSGKLHLIDVWRKRVEYPELRNAVLTLVENFGITHIVIEDKHVGVSLLADLWEKLGGAGIKNFSPDGKGDKLERAEAVLHFYVEGKIALPREARFLGALEEEITAFPNGYYDDQVDCLTMALWAVKFKLWNLLSLGCSRDPHRVKWNTDFKKIVAPLKPRARSIDPETGPWTSERVREDLVARIEKIDDEPHYSEQCSERSREELHDNQLARRDLLKALDRPEHLLSVKAFQYALRKLARQTSVSKVAFDARTYLEHRMFMVKVLKKDYAKARW